MTPSGIEPATFRFVVQHLNHCATAAHLTFNIGKRDYGVPGSSVGIATDYGLDGPGSNPGEDEIFRPSRPALGPTEDPVK